MGMSLNIKKGSLSDMLLTVLEKTIDGTLEFNHFVNNLADYSIFTGFTSRDYPLQRSALSKAIARLRKNGLVAQEKADQGEIILKLTDEGKAATLLMVEDNEQWDGKWRVVIFDIPEQKRLIRDLFRRNLKKWGFKHLQKSVWISKKHVTEKIISYIKYLKIEDWVLVIESDKIGPNPINTPSIKRSFKVWENIKW